MVARTWFGNRGVVKFARKGQTVGVVLIAKDIEVTPTGEFEELYGLGSTKRQDVAIHTKKVTIRFTVMKFDPVNNELWYIIDPDHTTGDFKLSDSSKVQLYTAEVYLDKDATAGNNVKLTVSDIYFESLPFSISENEWIGIELEGVGADITVGTGAYTA